jgi:hypothetical protein
MSPIHDSFLVKRRTASGRRAAQREKKSGPRGLVPLSLDRRIAK